MCNYLQRTFTRIKSKNQSVLPKVKIREGHLHLHQGKSIAVGRWNEFYVFRNYLQKPVSLKASKTDPQYRAKEGKISNRVGPKVNRSNGIWKKVQDKGLGAPCREKPLEKSGLEPAAPNRHTTLLSYQANLPTLKWNLSELRGGGGGGLRKVAPWARLVAILRRGL